MATDVFVSANHNVEIDALLYGRKRTGSITYSFPGPPGDYPTSYGGSGEPTLSGFGQAPIQMQAAINYAVGPINGYTNTNIQYAGTDGADIMVAQSPASNPTSYAYHPSSYYPCGDVWFGTAYDYSQASAGNYHFQTALHEPGHASRTGAVSLAATVTIAAPPATPVIASFSDDSVAGDNITDDNTPTLTGTAANSTVTVYDGATELGSTELGSTELGSTELGITTADSIDSWEYITSVLTDAVQQLKAVTTDSTRLVSSSDTSSVTIATTAPTTPVDDAIVNTSHGDDPLAEKARAELQRLSG